MKYVILSHTVSDAALCVYPIIFPEHLVHAEVARRMAHMIGFDSGFGPPDVLSAGFCEPGTNGFVVTSHGSESLRIDSKRVLEPRDARYLNLPSRMMGIVARED